MNIENFDALNALFYLFISVDSETTERLSNYSPDDVVVDGIVLIIKFLVLIF